MNTLHADSRIPVSSLVPFLTVALGLAWGIIALYIVLPEAMAAAVGPLSGNHPLNREAMFKRASAVTGVLR